MTTFETHLEYIKLGKHDREMKTTKTKTRLTQLNSRLDAFFKEQREALEEDIDKHAKSLKEYLREKESMDKVCK